jgi:hypothetical protein
VWVETGVAQGGGGGDNGVVRVSLGLPSPPAAALRLVGRSVGVRPRARARRQSH